MMNSQDSNPFGLSERDMETCRNIFDRYSEVTMVFIFGSRAKGVHHPGSDLDLAIMNPVVDPTVMRKIKSDFDESSLPYNVDLVLHADMAQTELKGHIDRVGKLFYQRHPL